MKTVATGKRLANDPSFSSWEYSKLIFEVSETSDLFVQIFGGFCCTNAWFIFRSRGWLVGTHLFISSWTGTVSILYSQCFFGFRAVQGEGYYYPTFVYFGSPGFQNLECRKYTYVLMYRVPLFDKRDSRLLRAIINWVLSLSEWFQTMRTCSCSQTLFKK